MGEGKYFNGGGGGGQSIGIFFYAHYIKINVLAFFSDFTNP